MSTIIDDEINLEKSLYSLKDSDDSNSFVVYHDALSENSEFNLNKNGDLSDNKSSKISKEIDNEAEMGLSTKIIKFIKQIQNILNEDKIHFESLEKGKKSSIDALNHLPCIFGDQSDMLPKDIDDSLNILKEKIINRFYLYNTKSRDMDIKIMQLEEDKINTKQLIESQKSRIRKLEKSKVEPSLDPRNTYKSLAFETTNRRKILEMENLKAELKFFQDDINEIRNKKKDLKKDFHQLQMKYDDINDERLVLLRKQKKMEVKMSKLENQLEELKNENSNFENTILRKDELINKLKEDFNDQDKIKHLPEQPRRVSFNSVKADNNRLSEEMKKENELLKSDKQKSDEIIIKLKEEIKEKENKIKELMEQSNPVSSYSDEAIDVLKKEYEDLIGKKERAIENMRKKVDAMYETKCHLESENKRLAENLKSIEAETQKKQEIITILRDKVKDANAAKMELENMRQIKQNLSVKEFEIEKITTHSAKLSDDLEEKDRELELMKKKNRELEMDIKNLKKMISKNKPT